MVYNIYLISSEYNDGKFYKIGWTKRNPKIRLKELKTANSQDLNIEYVFPSKFGPKIEKNLHRKYSDKRCNGEWFELNQKEVSEFLNECKKQHDMFQMLIDNNTWVQDKSKEFKKYI
jgi:hypothetical protein